MDMTHGLYVLGALLTGATVGCATMGLFAAQQDSAETPPDQSLLDFLEASECNVFFNDRVDGGAWGILGADNKVIAAAPTIRSTLRAAQNLARAE